MEPERPRESPLRADLLKCYRISFGTESPSWRQRLRLWLTHFGLQCVAAYRLERFARRFAARHRVLGRPLLVAAAFLGHAVELFHHVRIYADVGPGLYIGHLGTIYVGPTTIGCDLSLSHNVTIGYGHAEIGEGMPVIGDHVWIGTGSVVSGAIHVGDGVTIANGTMLARSVPARCLVAGNPGRVTMQGYDNAALLCARPAAAERAGCAEERAAVVGDAAAEPARAIGGR
jgi:serine O-acetyltransferase